MIIDCHVHVNNYHDENVDNLGGCLDDLRLQMRRNRVDAALILTSYKVVPGRPSTKSVVDAVRPFDNLFVVAGLSYSNFSQNDLDPRRARPRDQAVPGVRAVLSER